MFIVPDEFNDWVVCDVCHKYLTVGPVKQYPDGRTKCGRCSRLGDSGALCEFGLFAKQGVFKCVNRFDGCRQLLNINQVIEHESVCHSMNTRCPSCPEQQFVANYKLVRHFDELHPDCYLAKPSFRLRLGECANKTYLTGNNLFFIDLMTISSDTIKLNAIYLGKRGYDFLTQKFIVHFGDGLRTTESAETPCSVREYSCLQGFVFERPRAWHEFVYVEFRLNTGKLELALAGKESEESEEEEDKVSLPRRVFVQGRKDPYLTTSRSLTSMTLKLPGTKSSTKLTMHCLACRDPFEGNDAVFARMKQRSFRSVCSQCKHYAQKVSRLHLVPASAIYRSLTKLAFEYSCVWRARGCSNLYTRRLLDKHESACPFQVPPRCPVPGCGFKDRLSELALHFLEFHYGDTLVIGSIVEVERGSIPPETIYFWAYYGFVAVKVAPHGNGDSYRISFDKVREQPGGGADLRPRILILMKNKRVPLMIKDRSTIRLSNGNAVYISTFFEGNA